MSDETDDDSDIVNQLAYVRADPTQQDTSNLLMMIDAAMAEIIGLRMQLRAARAEDNQSGA